MVTMRATSTTASADASPTACSVNTSRKISTPGTMVW